MHLTLDQVADLLQVDVRMIRKLARCQRDEDSAAAIAGRPSRIVGLRALYLSTRVTRVTEAALGEYLESEQLRLSRRRRGARSCGVARRTR